MGEYRVYRAGEDEAVRMAGGAAAPRQLTRGAERVEAASSRRRRRILTTVGVVAIAAAFALIVFFGRDVFGNSKAAFDLAKLSGKVPGWAMVVGPVVAVAVLALVTAYLAFGRSLAIKLVAVAVLVVVLVAPGLALGYANGTVSVVGSKDAETQQIVTAAKTQLTRPIPNKPMNILLIGSDKSKTPGDTGRSDTQILVRLDPRTKSISMLSLPRDLRVYIDGVGYNKMNAAYSYGGPKLVIKTFEQVTGLPINHFIEVNFAGFWHVVNILGGVYIPVDHRYFVPASADYKSINLQPGYQIVRGKQALNFVRFRHDQRGDFTRMQRQQLFLRELQRQSGRWSHDWGKVIRLIRAITSQTKSDIDSLKVLKPLVELVFQVDTAKINSVHVEGSTPMIGGVSYVEASQGEIDAAVKDFTDPQQAPIKVKGLKLSKKMYPVNVYNGSGIPGLATSAANQLTALGYRAEAQADAPEFPEKVTVVYAPKSLEVPAKLIGSMFWPSDVRLVDRTPGVEDAISVFVASSFDGTIVVPKVDQQATQTLQKNVRYDASSWRALDKQTPLHLQMPTAWSPGMTYDQFRSYTIKDTDGKRRPAAVAVVQTPQLGYWDIQAMRWTDPPAVQHPNVTQTIDGTQYMLFYQGDNLHMVAWKHKDTLFWVLNTIDNQLSNDLMLGLATSFKPVK